MWRQGTAVAGALLCLGGIGGWVVASSNQPEPVTISDPAEPVPAVSPSVPIPPRPEVSPDPTEPPLQPGQPMKLEELRITDDGPGAAIAVPEGWRSNRLPNSQTWVFVPPSNTFNTYNVRVRLMIGDQVAPSAAKTGRVAALRAAEEDGNLSNLDIVAETSDSFEATYIQAGYVRTTMERWRAEDGISYVNVAVTGRLSDADGLRDLLQQCIESASRLDATQPD